MRSLKKLLAVIMTVAMIASIMVPALAADYDDDAQKLYKLGLFKGTSGSSYQPDLDATLIRETGLALMIRAMGLEEEVLAMSDAEVNEQLAKVVDASDIADWARPYVAYAVKNGLTKGIDASVAPNIKFGAKLDLSGREFIGFMLYAMGYTNVGWDDFLDKAAEIGMLSASEAVKFGTMNPINRDNAVGILAKSMRGITASGITLAQALVEAGVVSEEDMVEAGYMDPLPTPTPEVITAEAYADNLIQLYVEFSAEVDKDSAEDVDNYSIKDVDIASAALQDDGATVVLTFEYDSARKQQDVVDLTIDGVKAADGTAIGEITIEDIEFVDTTIPTALKAEVIGKDTLKVTFSEPMKGSKDGSDYVLNKKDFVVNGGKSYVRSVKLQNNYTEALVEMYSDLKEGALTLQVKSGSEDFAGFGVIGKTFNLEVVPDEEAPEVIGYEKASRSEVTLIWNEDIKLNCKEADIDEYFYHTNSKNPVKPFAQEGVKIDGNKLTMKFDDDYLLPNGTAYVYVMKEAVKDYWDNKNAQQMIIIEVVPDEEPPAVDKIEVKDEHIIEITFTEDLDDDADDKDNFTILDSKGNEVKNIIKTAVLSGKKITITFKKDLAGDYSIVLENIEDKAGNKMAKTTVPFTVGDITAPDHTKFKATLFNAGEEGQMLKISFGDTMATDGNYSVTDIEKYSIITISGATETEVAKLEEIDGVEIEVVDDGKAVEIYVPSDDDVDDPREDDYLNLSAGQYVKIARVADAAGNKMTVMTHNILIEASEKIEIDKAEAVARDVIEITFKDNVTAFEAEDIWIQVGETAGGDPIFLDQDDDIAGVSTKLNDDGNTVAVFTLDREILAYDVEATGNEVYIWVKPNANGVTESENRYGKTLKLYGEGDEYDESPVPVKDKVAPELYDNGNSNTHYAETGADAYVGDVLKINKVTVAGNVYNFTATIFFTEELDVTGVNGIALAGSDFVITLDGDSLVNGKDYWVIGYGVDGNGVGFITFAIVGEENADDGLYELIGDLAIERAADPKYVVDVNDNKIAEFDEIEIDNLNLTVPIDND